MPVWQLESPLISCHLGVPNPVLASLIANCFFCAHTWFCWLKYNLTKKNPRHEMLHLFESLWHIVDHFCSFGIFWSHFSMTVQRGYHRSDKLLIYYLICIKMYFCIILMWHDLWSIQSMINFLKFSAVVQAI